MIQRDREPLAAHCLFCCGTAPPLAPFRASAGEVSFDYFVPEREESHAEGDVSGGGLKTFPDGAVRAVGLFVTHSPQVIVHECVHNKKLSGRRFLFPGGFA